MLSTKQFLIKKCGENSFKFQLMKLTKPPISNFLPQLPHQCCHRFRRRWMKARSTKEITRDKIVSWETVKRKCTEVYNSQMLYKLWNNTPKIKIRMTGKTNQNTKISSIFRKIHTKTYKIKIQDLVLMRTILYVTTELDYNRTILES